MATAKNTAAAEEVKNNGRVRIFTVPDMMNPKDNIEGYMNGRFYRIKRGEVVDVPEDIASWLIFNGIAKEVK